MMRFSLHCPNEHQFEGWFRNNADYENQQQRGLLSCPLCNSTEITKALMVPAISTTRKKEAMNASNDANAYQEIAQKLQEFGKQVRENSENVGERFAEEALKIHFGEADKRSIYGKATGDEISALKEEGVAVMSLPLLPEEQN